jgi:hypothetical protein
LILQLFIGIALGHVEDTDFEAATLEFLLAEADLVPDEEAEPEDEAPTLKLLLAEVEMVPDEGAEPEELPEDVSCAEDVPFCDGVGVVLEPSLSEVDTTPDKDPESEELGIPLSDPVAVT